nr:hypothetical protein HK105_005962 [Polyrhizophydium stewartii]
MEHDDARECSLIAPHQVGWGQECLVVGHQTVASSLRVVAVHNLYFNLLLVFVPLGIVAGVLKWDDTVVFVLNFLAIVPLAKMLDLATDELSKVVGQSIGALINASFGNAVELAMVSLHEKVRGIRNGLGRKNIPFRTDVEYGDARKVVLELVEASQATILIVGSRGRTSLKGALLGSVSQYLLTNAPIPVIVVRHPKGQTPK